MQPGTHAENPETKRRLRNLLEVSGILDHLVPIKPRPATVEELARVHTAAHIEKIREMASVRKMRDLPASIAVWIATVTYVRHEHSSYDTLLAEGYDRDAARFFVVDEMNETLTRWRATRLLDPDDSEAD